MTRSHLIGNAPRVLRYRVGDVLVDPFRSLQNVSLGSESVPDHIFHTASRHIHHLGSVIIYFTCGTREVNRVRSARTPRSLRVAEITGQRPENFNVVPVDGKISWEARTVFGVFFRALAGTLH